MNKEFIPYEEALALKELGYNELNFATYINESALDERAYCKNGEDWVNGKCCSAPLYQQTFKWFRDNYNLNSFIYPVEYKNNERSLDIEEHEFAFNILRGNYPEYFISPEESEFDTYEEAELACLRKLIEIAKYIDSGRND